MKKILNYKNPSCPTLIVKKVLTNVWNGISHKLATQKMVYITL